jgi:hypothetical protein
VERSSRVFVWVACVAGGLGTWIFCPPAWMAAPSFGQQAARQSCCTARLLWTRCLAPAATSTTASWSRRRRHGLRPRAATANRALGSGSLTHALRSRREKRASLARRRRAALRKPGSRCLNGAAWVGASSQSPLSTNGWRGAAQAQALPAGLSSAGCTAETRVHWFQLLLFGMQNRTFVLILAATRRIQ